jgi:hypothetical protein
VFGIKCSFRSKWAAYAVALVLALVASIPVLFPMIQEYRATSKADTAKAAAEKAVSDAEKAKADAEKAMADANKAKADADAAISRTNKEASDQQWSRFKEYQNHFGKDANHTQKFFDNVAQGSLQVSYYTSDGCLLVERKGPGQNQAIMRDWIPAKAIRLDAPPGDMGEVKVSRLDAPTPENRQFLNAAYLPASFAPAGGVHARANEATVGCLDPHPGQFQTWNGQQNGCWIQVWRRWADGCQHFQWFNSCNGYWDNHPNGAPRVYWTNCAH